MPNWTQIAQLTSSLANLGARRLAALAIAGLTTILAIGLVAYYLGRPAMQPIYTGLSAQDVARMSSVLSEEGIAFDVNEQRSSLLVPFGQTTRARSLLAQRGLPESARSGYELFDQMGSIGLTSFMQEITRIRALEGEISRTIQALDGVLAARVHLVLQDQGSFRRERREPSGSVLLRLDERWKQGSAQAVRHIVAAAVPSMKIEHVSVTSTDGRILATGGDEQQLGNLKLSEMERSMAADLEQRAGRTLASALGEGNYQVSVAVRLDVDRQQINETIFDPKSRVERSVRTVKQLGSSEDASAKPTVGVQANLPQAEDERGDASKRMQRDEKREELVNYELNTKSVQTVRDGYRVQRMTIATVVNRKRIAEQLGANASKADVDARLAELSRLIAASTGAKLDQQDRLEISAVDFEGDAALLQASEGLGIVDYFKMNIGTGLNVLGLLAAVLVLVFFGLRPLARVAATPQPLPAEAGQVALDAPPGLGLPSPDAGLANLGMGGFAGDAMTSTSPTLLGKAKLEATRDRLSSLIDADDEQVAKVLKSWMLEAKEA